MDIISIINLKGGVGKTISAVNIAHILATVHRRRVLLVDNDKQGNTTKFFCGDTAPPVNKSAAAPPAFVIGVDYGGGDDKGCVSVHCNKCNTVILSEPLISPCWSLAIPQQCPACNVGRL